MTGSLVQNIHLENLNPETANYKKFRVQLVLNKTVFWDVVVSAKDKAHATKLAIRGYRDAGRTEDPWDTIIVRREKE